MNAQRHQNEIELMDEIRRPEAFCIRAMNRLDWALVRASGMALGRLRSRLDGLRAT